ncbi:hypothetical protein [Sphingomonas sp. OV641]|uniref:hypothetical protein n=1 Tax=Sphingomonas sp. OV641 TaxID=1881068 RepID=UPI0035292AB2
MLPRGGTLAGAQTHHRVPHTQRLPRLHGEIAADAVALVEQADHGAALRHGRAAGIHRRCIALHRHDIGRRIVVRGVGHLLAGRGPRIVTIAAKPARALPRTNPKQCGNGKRAGRDRRLHASGLHAS